MNDLDTIIAPATSVGDSGIAIVRISGNDALSFLTSNFRSSAKVEKYQSHLLYFGRLIDSDGSVVDEVMSVYMAPPRTYTREPVVEIHCHSSRQIVKKILELATLSGIRLARPGEFTYRAYLNGRLDLVQAEAVSRLIHSTSEFSRKASLQQLDGHLSRQIHLISSALVQTLVQIEAWIDFPEEDLPDEDIDQIQASVQFQLEQVRFLLSTYKTGRLVHDGAIVVLAGPPNAGKSSLMNALLREERAIVSPIPGTTRDLVEESIDLGGIRVRLFDTAGLRDSNDTLEKEGVRRAKDKLKKADLVLLLHDATEEPSKNFYDLLTGCLESLVIVVLTKADLVTAFPKIFFSDGPVVKVSAKLGNGIDELKDTITNLLLDEYYPDSEPSYLTERRHYEALSLASGSLDRFVQNLRLYPLDLLAVDLRSVLHVLGEVTGEVSNDSILDAVFSQFCIGK